MSDAALVSRVVTWILEGNTAEDVREAIAAPVDAGGLGRPEMVGELLTAGLVALAARFDLDSPRLSFHIEARRELYRRSMALADYKTCLSVLQDLAKLEGLYTQPARPETPISADPTAEWPTVATMAEYPTQ